MLYNSQLIRDSSALPDSITMSTQERAQKLQALGQSKESSLSSARCAIAAACFTPIDATVVNALSAKFTDQKQLTRSARQYEVSDETVGVLHKAQKEREEGTALFDTVQIWSNDQEALVVCSIKIDKDTRNYFLVDQWGEKLTSIDEIVRSHQRQKKFASFIEGFTEYAAVPTGITSLAIVITVLCGITSPWLLLLALCLSVGAHVMSDEAVLGDTWNGWLITATVFAVLGSAAFGITAIVDAENRDRHADVLACKIGELGLGDVAGNDDQWIDSPQGEFNLQAGTYLGRYFSDGDDAVKTLTEGKSYRLTYHGNIGNNYVSEVKEIRSIGTCGK